MGVQLNVVYDKSFCVEDLISVELESEGVYILMDDQKDVLYVGQARDLKGRLHQHIEGKSNISDYYKEIKYISVIFEADENLRVLAEEYLISIFDYQTKNRIDFFRRRVQTRNKHYVDTFNIFGRCQGISITGQQCKNKAHQNGYCWMHGGNRVTNQVLIEKAVEDYLAGVYKPQID